MLNHFKKLAALIALGISLTASRPAAAQNNSETFEKGDVLASVGSGKVEWWRNYSYGWTCKKTLDTGQPTASTDGLSLDYNNYLYVASSNTGKIFKFSPNGTFIGTITDPTGTPISPIWFTSARHESIGGGDSKMFLGRQGGNILRYNPFSYTSMGVTSSSGWVDVQLASFTNQAPRQLWYTQTSGSSHLIMRKVLDYSTPDLLFASLGPDYAPHQFRVIPGGGVAVAATKDIKLFNASGGLVNTLDITSPSAVNDWYALDCTEIGSIYAAGASGTTVYVFHSPLSSASGAPCFSTNTGSPIRGLLVCGTPRGTFDSPSVDPCAEQNFDGTALVTTINHSSPDSQPIEQNMTLRRFPRSFKGTSYITSSIPGNSCSAPGIFDGGYAPYISIQKGFGPYWNGSYWTNEFTVLPTESVRPFDNEWFMPEGSLPSTPYDVPNGQYRIATYRKLQPPSSSTLSSTYAINIDNAIPSINFPLNNATVTSPMAQVTGTATDGLGNPSSGLSSIYIQLERFGENPCWSGSHWSATKTDLLATGTSNWSYPMPFLLPGTYYVKAKSVATDGSVSVWSSPTTKFTISTVSVQSPIINVESPWQGSAVKELSLISGLVVAPAASPQFHSVKVLLKRNSDGLRWNGTAWVNNDTGMTATLGTYTWEIASNLPTATNLPTGSYSIKAIGTNTASGTTVDDDTEFMVDKVAPTVAIVTPANGATLYRLPSISGTAIDNAGGSGAALVNVKLKRLSDHKCWSGFYWESEDPSTYVFTSLSGNNWTTRQPLPAPAQMFNGNYSITAIAYDQLGNTGQTTVNFSFQSDTIAPDSVDVSIPADASTVNGLSSVSGHASDFLPLGQSGIDHVDLNLQRESDNHFWNGTDWSSTVAVALPTVYTAIPNYYTSGNWIITTGLPSGSNLTAGTYKLTAIAYDKAYNSLTSAINTFTVDGVPTSCVVTLPANNAGNPALSIISGTATDDVGGSGIARVGVYLRRLVSPGVFEFWAKRSGVWGWASDTVPIPAYVNGTNWSVAANSPAGTVLPSGANLTEGTYTVNAWAYDALNSSVGSALNTFYIDTAVPTAVSVTTPANVAVVNAVTSIAGTASDNTGGSGIGKVNAYLRRVISSGVYEYWAKRDGIWGWASDIVSIPTTLNGTSWSATSSSPAGTTFPSGADLPDGQYIVNAYAYDKANNYLISGANLFTVDKVAPSTITLTAPASGSGLRTLTTINGASSDNAGGSGIAKVDVYLYRVNGGATEYWGKRSGVWGWAVTIVPNPATVYSTSWSLTESSPAGSTFPSGSDFPDGVYFARAWAYDKAGNSQATSTNSFTVSSDEIPPAIVTVTTPDNGTGLRTITTINGVSSDNTGGSGIGRVDAYLYRVNGSVTEYWGSRSGVWGWGTSAAPIPATVYSTSWSVTAASPAGTLFPEGANLPDGIYYVKAFAYDKAGNGKNSVTNVFTASSDELVPISATVTSPASGSALNAITGIYGLANDDPSGSGIARVNAYLRRVISSGVYEYWGKRSGTWGWASDIVPIPATVAGTNWSVTSSSPAGTIFPSGADLLDGQYIVNAYAYDKANNLLISGPNLFVVDKTTPASATVTTPTTAANLQSITIMNGTATDNAGGSGIGRVDATLRHVISSGVYEYWAKRSGTWGWGSDLMLIPTTLTGSNWSATSSSPAGTTFPSGTNLPDGQYIVNAYAYDKANNLLISSANLFVVDKTTPASVTVTTPADAASVQSLPVINGTVTDNAGGSGIAIVNAYLGRQLSAGVTEYWGNRSGTWGWGTSVVAIPATISGTNWSISSSSPAGTVLPSGANLPNGNYAVNAWAYDKAGNSLASDANSFTVSN